VKWLVYSQLTNKELKEILTGRKMPIYGKKEILVRRLENKDKRRHTYLGCLEKSGLRLPPEADHIPNRYNSNLMESFIGNIDATRQRSSSAHSSSSAALQVMVGMPRWLPIAPSLFLRVRIVLVHPHPPALKLRVSPWMKTLPKWKWIKMQ
jgi:hypothetical protein